jgi:hypothetical protein
MTSSNLPRCIPRWADDDDDGKLDVYDTAALTARLEQANPAGVPTPPNSQVATLASVPTPLVLNTQMAIRPHPFAQASVLETKSRVHLEAQPTHSEENAQPTRPEETAQPTRLDENTLPTTWHGIPLLPEDKTATSFVDARRWNIFAAHVTEEAAPQAAFLFRELQRRSTSSEDAKA